MFLLASVCMYIVSGIQFLFISCFRRTEIVSIFTFYFRVESHPICCFRSLSARLRRGFKSLSASLVEFIVFLSSNRFGLCPSMRVLMFVVLDHTVHIVAF